MKKILCLFLLIATSMLTGCSEGYPYIEYHHTPYNFDMNNREIEVPDGYVLNQGNSYEFVKTEDGYDLIIHFVEEE